MIAPADHGNISSAPTREQQVCHHRATPCAPIKALINAVILKTERSVGQKDLVLFTYNTARRRAYVAEDTSDSSAPSSGPKEFKRVCRMIY